MLAVIAMSWEDVGVWLSLIGGIATIVALALAIMQGKTILRIRESLSTQYLGRFPEFMPAITRMIESARHTIDILCDVPAYGFFTDQLNWLNYESAIKLKLAPGANVKIRFACLGKNERSSIHDSQFSHAFAHWNE